MAKLIEIIGPAGVGKTTILKSLVGNISNKNVGIISNKNIPICEERINKIIKKYDVKTMFRAGKKIAYYDYITNYDKKEYIITERFIHYYIFLVLMSGQSPETITKNSWPVYHNLKYWFINNYKNDFLQKILNEFPNLSMVFNIKCDIEEILYREENRPKPGKNVLYPYKKRLEILKTDLECTDIICEFLKSNGVHVYDINSMEPPEKVLLEMNEILKEEII